MDETGLDAAPAQRRERPGERLRLRTSGREVRLVGAREVRRHAFEREMRTRSDARGERDGLFITEDGNEDITKYPYGPEFNVVG